MWVSQDVKALSWTRGPGLESCEGLTVAEGSPWKMAHLQADSKVFIPHRGDCSTGLLECLRDDWHPPKRAKWKPWCLLWPGLGSHTVFTMCYHSPVLLMDRESSENTQAALVCEHHRVHLHKPRWPGLLHNQTIGYSPLCLGYKPVQQVNTQNDVRLNQVREKMMQSRCGKEEMYEDAAGRTRDNVLQQTFFCNWKVCTPTKSIVSA